MSSSGYCADCDHFYTDLAEDPQTAMLLTESEWDDLAAMLSHYNMCIRWIDNPERDRQKAAWQGEDAVARLEEHLADLRRKRSLATRIIEACE